MNVEELSLDEWDRYLPSTGFEVFHTPDALSVMDRHLSGNLRLYGGFKGEQPVGLLPVFEQQRSMGRALLSPPPSSGTPHLGPIVMSNSPKRRKRERVNQRFVSGVLDELAVDSARTLVRFVCATPYADPRPYRWAGLDVSTDFTYHLDVAADDPAELLGSFSKSLRREIRSLKESEVTVSVVDDSIAGADLVYDDISARYAEQDEPFPLTREYVHDLVAALDDRCRVYVARDENDSYLTGVIVLYSSDAAYYWEGGARASYDDSSVNSLLHWTVIRDVAVDPALESVHRYDMVGANTERLCSYKAKFSPELVPYYVVESSGTTMELAKTAYSWLKG